MSVAQPMDRCRGIDASTLSRLLDDEIDGALGEGAARAPNGREDGRRRRRVAAAGKPIFNTIKNKAVLSQSVARTRAGLSTTFWGSALCRARLGWRRELANVGRQRDADGLEYAADVTSDRRAQQEALAILFCFDLLQTIEFPNECAPLGP
jgi:hypothetical protein